MFKTSAKKTALLKSCIKDDVSSQRETKRYLVGLCETRFVERHVSIPVKHSKLRQKIFEFVFFFVFCCIFILLSRESDQCAIRARLGVAGHLSIIPRWGKSR